MVSKSSPAVRREVVLSFISHDLLGLTQDILVIFHTFQFRQ